MSRTLRSVTDVDLPPLVEAERELGDLRARFRTGLIAAAVLGAAAVAAATLAPPLALVLGTGAAAALVVAALAQGRRGMLMGALLQVRDAYRIAQVSAAGTRFASRARRRRLADSLHALVCHADEHPPTLPYTVAPLDDRVRARRARLMTLEAALAGDERELHPAGVVIVHRLLTRPGHSPFFNPDIDETALEDALHRVEACYSSGQITP